MLRDPLMSKKMLRKQLLGKQLLRKKLPRQQPLRRKLMRRMLRPSQAAVEVHIRPLNTIGAVMRVLPLMIKASFRSTTVPSHPLTLTETANGF